VESTNNQVRAATDQTVTLFITPSFLGSASDAATGGKRLLGDQNLLLKPIRRSYYFTSIRYFIWLIIIAAGCCKRRITKRGLQWKPMRPPVEPIA